MNDTRALIHIDDGARDRIRRTLRRYMEESRIGTPTLQVRIIEGDTPRHREIPLSTLQRFLTGSHRTSDHHVSLCYDFVKELPYYGEGKDIAIFGSAAYAFFQPPPDADARTALITALERDVAGTYEASMLYSVAGDEVERSPSWEQYIGRVLLSHNGETTWLEVQEVVHGGGIRGKHFKLEGAALYAAPHLHVFLRDLLTRKPKIYALRRRTLTDEQGEHEIFEGHGHDADPWPGIEPRAREFFGVRFLPWAYRAETQ
jgi:hypothetical protein